jgi:hypothetical protein
MQMTIRGISKPLRQAMEERAKAEGKSLNQVAIESLEKSLDPAPKIGAVKRDLSFMIGTPEEARELEEALKDFDHIDPEDWK